MSSILRWQHPVLKYPQKVILVRWDTTQYYGNPHITPHNLQENIRWLCEWLLFNPGATQVQSCSLPGLNCWVRRPELFFVHPFTPQPVLWKGYMSDRCHIRSTMYTMYYVHKKINVKRALGNSQINVLFVSSKQLFYRKKVGPVSCCPVLVQLL